MKRDAASADTFPPYWEKGRPHGRPIWAWLFWVCRNPRGGVDDTSADQRRQRRWSTARVHRLRSALILEAMQLPWAEDEAR